jgi:hypothetical protein
MADPAVRDRNDCVRELFAGTRAHSGVTVTADAIRGKRQYTAHGGCWLGGAGERFVGTRIAFLRHPMP